MTHDCRRYLVRPIAAALLLGLALGESAAAQGADFLFRRPSVTLGVQVGYALPRAGSEIFDFTREQLTVEKSDFNSVSFGGEVAVRATDRLDVAANLGFEKSSTRSEFRDWVDQDDLPIEQTTRFLRVPLTVGVKFYLTDRGRRISRFSWIPKRWAPYLGAGGGVVWYEFDQTGDFVDFETFDIFFSDFESRGTSPLAYVAAGSELSLGARWLLTGEARYAWASAEMDRDFVGFDNIDLAGFRAALGFAVRF